MKAWRRVAWLLLVTWVVASCGEEPLSGVDEEEAPAFGRVTGFVSPITIPVAEAILFRGEVEIARVAFRDGVFAFEEVAPGTVRLEIRAFGYRVNDAGRGIVVRAGETTDVGRVIMIGLDDGTARTPHVRGIVRDTATGEPIGGVRIKASCTAGVCTVQRATSDADGAYRVPIPADFETELLFTRDGYRSRSVRLDPVPTGAFRELDVALNRLRQ